MKTRVQRDPRQVIASRCDLTLVSSLDNSHRELSRFENSTPEIELATNVPGSVLWLRIFSREMIPKDVMHKNQQGVYKTHIY